jgi:hypothetical protein
MKHSHRILLAISALVATTALHAEPSKFASGDLTVVPASRVVSDGSRLRFEVGEELMFLKAPTFGPAEREITLRLFSLPDGWDVPRSWKTFEPCDVYVSVLRQATVNAGGPIKFFTLHSGWLNAKADGTVGSRRLLAVFEEGNGDGVDIVRLHRDHAKPYFSKGVVVVVEPERRYSKDEALELAKAQEDRGAQTRKDVDVNQPRFHCYRVTAGLPAGASSDGALYAMNDDCESEIPLP